MDIVVLAATREELVQELASASLPMKEYVSAKIRAILSTPNIVSAIPSHIRDRDPRDEDVEQRVMGVFADLAAL
jgi:hypothetical protein